MWTAPGDSVESSLIANDARGELPVASIAGALGCWADGAPPTDSRAPGILNVVEADDEFELSGVTTARVVATVATRLESFTPRDDCGAIAVSDCVD